MKFQEISEKEYTDFWVIHPLKTFLSAPEISKLREKNNWMTYYVGIKENDVLVAATMLLAHKRKFNKYEFYSPRGYLIDFKNKELVKYFTKELKKYIKSKNGYVLRIDPYVILKERDNAGDIVENGENNEEIVNNLLSLGFKKILYPQKEQVGWMFSINLEGKTEEDIMNEMQSSTRNQIRKAEKFGINVKEINYDELDEFQNIMEETSKRKKFTIRKLTYYQEMYKLFHDKNEVKFYISTLNLKEYILKLKEEKQEKEERLKTLTESKNNEGKRQKIVTEIESLEKRINESEEIKRNSGKDIITLSGSMFMLVKPEVLFLAGGNYEEYMNFNSQYLIQWELIKYAIANGYKKYNFYGIPENINTHPKDYGIYEFKRRFGGYVEELIGEFALPITWHYKLFKIIQKIKH